MTTGIVEGGWEFVIAAYVLTGSVLTIYAVSLFMRLRKESR
ncbi:MAG TPA: hypothetical protein VGF69_17390 [Thermoanaerobaculia bacterium]|jgi:hypothetical protein